MKAPELYRVIQIPLKMAVESGYKVEIGMRELPRYYVRQGDCALFAQLRRITGQGWERDRVITEIIFAELGTQMKNKEVATRVVRQGIQFNGGLYVLSERSASMKRNGYCSFVRAEYKRALDEALTIGADLSQEVVFSKWGAYRGLYLSSGFLI